MISLATEGSLTPDEILSLPIAQGLQLRGVGLMKQNVKLKPVGGGTLREKAYDILGDWADEWIN